MENEERQDAQGLRDLLGSHQNFKTPKGYFENFEESLFSNIDDENIPKNTGFSVPDNYFKEFDEKVLPIEDIVDDVPLNLKQNSFKTPSKYFESFDDKLMHSLASKAPSNLTLRKSKNKVRKLIVGFSTSIAAAFLLYLGVQQGSNKEDTSIESISENELNEWILAGNMEIDTYTIASMEPEMDDSSTFMYNGISDEDLNNYLDTVDTELLY
tara:strand:- start:138 stop:773 length:636 start_codon:yes stop_codon:yes gene_type:complete